MARNVQIKMSIQGDELFKLRGWAGLGGDGGSCVMSLSRLHQPGISSAAQRGPWHRAREYSQHDKIIELSPRFSLTHPSHQRQRVNKCVHTVHVTHDLMNLSTGRHSLKQINDTKC